MKKKMLECPVHGLTLHRCKRKCWAKSSSRSYADEYTERCYKCEQEGKHNKVVKFKKKQKHLSFSK